MLKRYRFRAYPTPGQAVALARLFGCVRVVYNDVVAARRTQHEHGLPYESASALQTKLVTQAKQTPQRAWLSEVSSTPLQQAVRDADRAYRNFFDSLTGKRKGRRVGAPRFRSRRDNRQAARFTRQAFTGGVMPVRVSREVGKLKLPKIGWVRFEMSRPLPSAPSSVTVIREADGRHYLSFVVDAPAPEVTAPAAPGRVTGVDLGLVDFAAVVSSDGTRHKVTNPRHLRAAQRRLARAQRALARKEKGSANRAKARTRVAAAHRKVRESRLDHHHKLALRLVRENQAIAVEGLSVSGLARAGATGRRGRGLRRSVHDAGWGTFVRVLTEKATEHGRDLIVIDRFAPTSQVCSVCGVQDGPKPLHVRTWTCGGCGTRLDRDYNAALNVLLAAGLAESLNACGGNIRRTLACAVPDEAGTHRTDQSHTLAA